MRNAKTTLPHGVAARPRVRAAAQAQAAAAFLEGCPLNLCEGRYTPSRSTHCDVVLA
jgi:hypothetical protein